MRFLLPMLALSAAPLAAQADLSVAVRGGTLGVGLEAAKLVTANLAVRGGVHRFSGSLSRTESDVAFDVEYAFRSWHAVVDFFPSGRGSFHLTGGVIAAPVELDGTGQPTDGSYTFNGREYTAAEVGTVTGSVRWPETMPYAGLGWGTPASRSGGLTFLLDLGVGIGKPTVGLSATSAIPGSTLAQDVAAERDEIQRDVDKYLKVYPVISIGLGLRF
jgi:hypothetical protein